MYARRVGDRELTFDFASGLLNDNLLIADRETGSLWSQLDGRAIDGPLADTPLSVIPALQTTWAHWKELHPDTRVMVVQGEEGHPYFYRTWQPGSPRPGSRPTAHDTRRLGLGLVIGDESMYFPFAELQRAADPVSIRLGGQDLVIRYRREALTAWAEDPQGHLLPGVLAYRFGWMRFHPESRIFHAGGNR